MAGYQNTRMKLPIIIVLFAYSLGHRVSPQDSNKCVMDRDVHELLVKLKCELVTTKEKMKTYEGRLGSIKHTLKLKLICVNVMEIETVIFHN